MSLYVYIIVHSYGTQFNTTWNSFDGPSYSSDSLHCSDAGEVVDVLAFEDAGLQ